MGKLQNLLAGTMQKVGTAIDKMAKAASRGKGKKPKKTGVTDEAGQDFSQIRWDEKQIQNLLAGSERKEILPLIPALAAKKILHLTTSRERFLEPVTKRGAQIVFELDVSKATVAHQTPTQAPEHPYARGSVEHLPFREDSFDFILYPSALTWRADLPALIPELSRCIRDGGRVLVSTVHPFFEYLMNPRAGFKKSIDSLFENMKKSGFFIEEVKEGTVDEAMRNVSLPQKMTQELQKYPGLPLVLAVKALRLRKKKTS